MINPKTLADGPLGISNFTVHLVGGKVDKSSGNLREKGLKAQALFQFCAEVGFRLGPSEFLHAANSRLKGIQA